MKRGSNRTKERVSEIDTFIRENYDTIGYKAVAKELGEPEHYIMVRRSLLKKRDQEKEKYCPDAKDKRIINLTHRIEELEERNHALREELIRLIHKYR